MSESSGPKSCKLSIAREPGAGFLRLRLSGALDATAGAEYGDAMLAALGEAPALHLHMEDLDYVSSAGVRILVQLIKDAKKAECVLKLEAVSPLVEEVLEISGIKDSFETV